MADENKKLHEIRSEFPVVHEHAYLNTGSVGPLPKVAYRSMEVQMDRQLQLGRVDAQVYLNEYVPMQEDLRARFARLLGAEKDEIALTHHATEGMNIAIWGLIWQPGDEIVTTTLEHEGGLLPVYAAARRFGLAVNVVDVGLGADEVFEKITSALSSRTRLVVLSHVTFTTGAVLPVAEIAAAAHKVGALVAVDGAQSAGAIPVDVSQLDVDFYAATGQKWLCGPEGVGALFVRHGCLSLLNPTFVGYSTKRDPEAFDLTGNFIPAVGARRYEISTVFRPGLFAMRDTLSWIESQVGYPWIFDHIQMLTKTCRDLLADLPGTEIITPPEHAGLTSFRIGQVEEETAVNALRDRGVFIRWVPRPRCFRVSTAFFNNQDDLIRLRDGLLAVSQDR